MTNDELRAKFEEWISQPPFDHSCERGGENSAWPGAYRLYVTEIAWEAWQACRAALLEQQAQWSSDEVTLLEAANEALGLLELLDSQHGVTTQLRAALQAVAPVQASAVPDGWVMVPRELIDSFPELNPNTYNDDDVYALNSWGIEIVLGAAPQPKVQS